MERVEYKQGKEAARIHCDESNWLARDKPSNPYEYTGDSEKYGAWEDGFDDYFMDALDALEQ
jgi:hypothetical protein